MQLLNTYETDTYALSWKIIEIWNSNSS